MERLEALEEGAAKGLIAAPVSRSQWVRMCITYAMLPTGRSASSKTAPWYDGEGAQNSGHLSGFSAHWKLPLSMIAPPMWTPWPPMNFVVE